MIRGSAIDRDTNHFVIRHPGRRITQRLSLALLVLGIFANHCDSSFTTNHLALFANFLDRSSYFHFSILNVVMDALDAPGLLPAAEAVDRNY